jgi:hypothetical protein
VKSNPPWVKELAKRMGGDRAIGMLHGRVHWSNLDSIRTLRHITRYSWSFTTINGAGRVRSPNPHSTVHRSDRASSQVLPSSSGKCDLLALDCVYPRRFVLGILLAARESIA